MEFISTYFELIVVGELALLVIGLFIISYENSANLGLISGSIQQAEARLLYKIDAKAKDLSQEYSDEDAEY